MSAASPPVPTVPLTRSGFPREASTVRVEEDSFYVPFVAPPADPWLWGLVFEDMGPASFPFGLPGLASAGSSVAVRIGLVGANDSAHAVEASLNGVALGEVRFTGAVKAELRGEVPAGALSATSNVLTLRYTSDDPAGYAFLDVLDLGVAADLDPPASVTRLEAYDPAPGSFAGVQYLVLSHSRFLEAAARVARAKSAEGLAARVVDVERAYDRYSGGVFEANAVAALVREARRQSPRIKYVLLVGDDTFDPRDRLGLGQVSYLPSVMAWDGQFGRVPSETAYADTDGDGAPDVAIGRLPVETPEEAQLLAAKVEIQEALLRPGRGRHLLVSDDSGADDVSFRAEAFSVARLLPPMAQRVFVDVGQGLEAARVSLLAGMREGAVITHYFGHGGPQQWADERLLDTGTAQGLAGAGRASLVLAWACESDWYQYHLGRSLGEELLLLPDGGSVASFGPSGITDPRAQAVLQRRLYPLLLQGVSVGEAVRRAKAAVVREEPWALPVVNGFSLLGDPALVLP